MIMENASAFLDLCCLILCWILKFCAQGDLGKKSFSRDTVSISGCSWPPKASGFSASLQGSRYSSKSHESKAVSQDFFHTVDGEVKSQCQPPFGWCFKALYKILAWTTLTRNWWVFSPDFLNWFWVYRISEPSHNMTYQSQAWENLMSGQPKPDVWPTNMFVGGKGIQNKTTFCGRQVEATNFSPTIQSDETTKPPNHQAELNFMPRHVVVMAISWGMMWFH